MRGRSVESPMGKTWKGFVTSAYNPLIRTWLHGLINSANLAVDPASYVPRRKNKQMEGPGGQYLPHSGTGEQGRISVNVVQCWKECSPANQSNATECSNWGFSSFSLSHLWTGPASGGHKGTPRLPARQSPETSHRVPAFIEYTWGRLWSLNSNLCHCIKEHSHVLQLSKAMNVVSTLCLLKKPIQNFPKRPICVPNVSTHFFKVEVSVSQSCPTLCNPMNCSPPGPSVHGTLHGQEHWSGLHALLQGIFPT